MIETERLRLVPLAAADAAAMVEGVRPEGANWCEGYPMEGTLVAAGMLLKAEAEGQPFGPFVSHQIVRVADGMVIGDVGFDGPPDADGDLHIGCGLCVPARGQGYAREAVRALIDWAHRQPGIRYVNAEAATPEAKRLLRAVGMQPFDQRARLVYFQG
jgi:RimJ/RimL family protein N-acetyltransferase